MAVEQDIADHAAFSDLNQVCGEAAIGRHIAIGHGSDGGRCPIIKLTSADPKG